MTKKCWYSVKQTTNQQTNQQFLYKNCLGVCFVFCYKFYTNCFNILCKQIFKKWQYLQAIGHSFKIC